MKKSVVKVTRKSTGEVWYSFSGTENNRSYKLTKDINDAQQWYGSTITSGPQKRIEADKKDIFNALGNDYEIVYIEEEPKWYFQLQYAIRTLFKEKSFGEVKKSFPLNPDIKYKIRSEWGYDRPLIDDLPLEELERYYKWRKENYRGKIREC